MLEGVRRAAEEVGSSLKDGGWGLVCVVGVSGLCGGCVRSVWWVCHVCVVGVQVLVTHTSTAGFEILFNVDYYTPEVKHADSQVCLHCKSIGGGGFKDHVMIT